MTRWLRRLFRRHNRPTIGTLAEQAAAAAAKSEDVLNDSHATRQALEQIRNVERIARDPRP